MKERKEMALRIGILVDATGAYGRGVVGGIAKYARAHTNWSLHLVQEWSVSYGETSRLSVNAVIGQITSDKAVELLDNLGLPAVNVADQQDSVPLPSVYSDNRAVGRLAAEHYLARGFANFAFCGANDMLYSRERREGFVKAVEKAGYKCACADEVMRDFRAAAAPEGLSKWIESLPKPVGIMTSNDVLAGMVVGACQKIGVRVPEEMAIIGVDDDHLICELSDVPLSSIALGTEQIGYKAGELLNRILSRKSVPSRPVLVEPLRVVTRRSSDILAIEDPEVAMAVRFVADHAAEPITVEDILEELSVSRRSLERRFRKVLGRSPSAEIRRVHVERAKTLLKQTDLPMPKVSGASGFIDAARLSKAFRRELGTTPTEYRNKSRIR